MGCTESTPVAAHQHQNRPSRTGDIVKTKQVLPSPSSTTTAATKSAKSSKDSTAITTPEGDADADADDDDDEPVDPETAAVTKIQAFVRGTMCRIQVGVMVQGLIDDLIHQQQKMVFDALDAAEAEDQEHEQKDIASVAAVAAVTEQLEDEPPQQQHCDDEPSSSSPPVSSLQQEGEEKLGHERVDDINGEDVVEIDPNSKQPPDSDGITEVVEEQHDPKEEKEEESIPPASLPPPPPPPPAKEQSLSYVHPDEQPAEIERTTDGRLPLWWMDHAPHKTNFDDDGGSMNTSVVVTTGTDFAAARSLFS